MAKYSIFFFLLTFIATTVNGGENEKANALFESIFQSNVARSPLFQTQLGIKTDYDKWDDLSEDHANEGNELDKKHLQKLREIKVDKLDVATALSYRLMEDQLQRDIGFFRWRHYNYPVNQMFGWHTTVPSVLINMHQVTSLDEAKDYVARVKNVSVLMEQLIEALTIRVNKGIIPPKFVFPKIIEDSKNLLTGRPFSKNKKDADSPILNNFKEKIAKLTLSEKAKNELVASLEKALVKNLMPGYQKLIAYLEVAEKKANNRAGAWKFPEGEAFYNAALQRTTTTDLSASEIHDIGLAEVRRIRGEMESIMKQVKFKGNLADFFRYIQKDDQFYYSNDKDGREQYLQTAVKLIEDIEQRADELFITKAKSKLKVKAVEAFRENSAGKAFYQSPPPDGSRPGIYYANLHDMRKMPKYQMAALAYHEGVPGHHLQLSISAELKAVPEFRKYARYTAYTEGWGLYSELLPKEIGLYKDPYSDFGRLAMEIWRACRLVVDTGIHAKKWTREKAIDYLLENSPNVKGDAVKAIERYIVMPSQATAYKIGMLKILELREMSKKRLGDKFDIREFHERVLVGGAMPLNILAEQIDQWVAKQL